MTWDQKYEVPHLDEFTVTEKKAQGVALPTMELSAWLSHNYAATGSYPEYEFSGTVDEIHVDAPRPKEVEVIHDGHTIVWQDDPNFDL